MSPPLPLSSSAFFIFFGVAGLWTHYSFPIVLAAAGLAFVISVGIISLGPRPSPLAPRPAPPLSGAQPAHPARLSALAADGYRPRADWPKGGAEVGRWRQRFALTLRTLLFGPVRTLCPEPLWPWLALAGILPLVGLVALRRFPFAALMTGLWLLLPVGMMFGLGLFTDAFLKFLLVASPAWCVLAAATP